MELATKHCGQSATEKPLVIDLFCGLGGWSEAFLDAGFRAVGFDIEVHDYGKGGYPGQLVLRDVRALSGSELVRDFGVPSCIVASPPCQKFSYMAMPWKKAKDMMRRIEASQDERAQLIDLFNQCFRIQREVCEAAGHYVPMIVENVRGAQKWVGKARWNFGSFYLWGDVPALMPIPSGKFHGQKLPVGNTTSPLWKDRPIARLCDAYKTTGMNWSDQTKRGQDFTRIAGRQAAEGIKGIPHRPAGHWTNPAEHDGVKGFTSVREVYNSRKEASAMIAKIPKPLALWIAKCYRPRL